MKLTVLVDNNTLIDRYFLAEPGVAYYIEIGATKILFDTGYSDIFLKNASRMGIDLLDIDILVLSHAHLDHTWGLQHLIQAFAERRFENRPAKRPRSGRHRLPGLPGNSRPVFRSAAESGAAMAASGAGVSRRNRTRQ